MAHAVDLARGRGDGLVVEVEADTIRQALEAVRAGADIVLLDNMDAESLSEAVLRFEMSPTPLVTSVSRRPRAR